MSNNESDKKTKPSDVANWPQRLRLTKNASGELGVSSILSTTDTDAPNSASYTRSDSPPQRTGSLAALQPTLDNATTTSVPQTPSGQEKVKAKRAAPVLSELLQNNKKWADRMTAANPQFFPVLSKIQAPQILWIGCSDSRVPANMIIDLAPGEVFVHRNVANIVTHTDFNALSVLQYAVEVLKVQHVIVCGHYGCGGVAASVESQQFGLIDNWLRHLKDLYSQHRHKLENVLNSTEVVPNVVPLEPATGHQPETPNVTEKNSFHVTDTTPKTDEEKALAKHRMLDLLCELNVARSLQSVCHSTIVQNAWDKGQKLSVHGWCYRLDDGLIRDLDLCVSSVSEIAKIFQMIDGKRGPHE